MAGTATLTENREKSEARGILALRAGVLSPKMILAFLLATAIFVSSAVSIVWTRNQVVTLGYEINNANVGLSSLKVENRKLVKKRYEYINLEELHRASATFDLRKPTDEQIIVIYDEQSAKEN